MRVHEGKYWTPDPIDDRRDLGIICKDNCHKRIRWKDLDITYELHDDMYRLWWCGYCGAMLREDNMTDVQLNIDLRKQEWSGY